MANIEISLNHPVQDEEIIQFTATADSGAVTGLQITYPVDIEGTKESKTFTFQDGHKNSLSGQENLFVSGASVTAVVRTGDNTAYILNGDTNAYLEGQLAAAFPKAGGTLTGKLILTSGVHYGTSLPTDDYTAGRIFLKKV